MTCCAPTQPSVHADSAARATARPRRTAEHQVPRDPELVPRPPRDDRQRLPVLPRPARPRADDELHPLRPGQRPPTTTPWPSRSARETGTCTPPIRCADLDALAAGGEYLRERGYHRSWGIGRHIQGSQIFDYWRDPDGFLVEHFTDGDMFDNTLEPGWAPSPRPDWPSGGRPSPRTSSESPPAGSPSRNCARCSPPYATRQRIHPHPPARPDESSQFMTTTVLRTADAWYVQTDTGAQ